VTNRARFAISQKEKLDQNIEEMKKHGMDPTSWKNAIDSIHEELAYTRDLIRPFTREYRSLARLWDKIFAYVGMKKIPARKIHSQVAEVVSDDDDAI
jgi:hypothetical protein